MNTNNIELSSPISSLLKTKTPSENLNHLNTVGIFTVEDLLWIFPLKIMIVPKVASFKNAIIGSYFRGQGTIISLNARPAFGVKGKGRALLYNVTATVKDKFSDTSLYLSWFNCYGSTKLKLEKIKEISFSGEVSEYKSIRQIANPEYEEGFTENANELNYLIQYPTIQGVPGSYIKKLMERIPLTVFDQIKETLPREILSKRNLHQLSETIKILHGKIPAEKYSEKIYNLAFDRLVYEEFFQEQIKVLARRQFLQHEPAQKFHSTQKEVDQFLKLLPFTLTEDQHNALVDIENDLLLGKPMMRLIQGDVGCGKTAIAFIASIMVLSKNAQVALMCPTETLAIQHFQTIQEYLKNTSYKVIALLGSQTAKEKKSINKLIQEGEVHFVVGTHSLFQDSVIFKNLKLAIIDEQHKFGVEQRIKLMKKGEGTHTLIMTATPIPRSLSLTQYGDLDFSIVKSIPQGRKGIKTRIVEPLNFDKYLSFVKTRLELNEQIYVVVPAIEESEKLDTQNLEQAFLDYKQYFPHTPIQSLHGRIKGPEKAQILNDFAQGKTKILISTSVIEVGINVPNATVMAILSPDRFGLSSLHQLRGRVGRGNKPGFCFLVVDENKNPQVMERLKVIESTTDGFKIAEADLAIRGEGDLFGTAQTGIATKRFANIFLHQKILYDAIGDVKDLIQSQYPPILERINKLKNDPKILATI